MSLQQGAGPESRAFDAWLRRSLADRHDSALAENLPGEWLELVQRAN